MCGALFYVSCSAPEGWAGDPEALPGAVKVRVIVPSVGVWSSLVWRSSWCMSCRNCFSLRKGVWLKFCLALSRSLHGPLPPPTGAPRVPHSPGGRPHS